MGGAPEDLIWLKKRFMSLRQQPCEWNRETRKHPRAAGDQGATGGGGAGEAFKEMSDDLSDLIKIEIKPQIQETHQKPSTRNRKKTGKSSRTRNMHDIQRNNQKWYRRCSQETIQVKDAFKILKGDKGEKFNWILYKESIFQNTLN